MTQELTREDLVVIIKNAKKIVAEAYGTCCGEEFYVAASLINIALTTQNDHNEQLLCILQKK